MASPRLRHRLGLVALALGSTVVACGVAAVGLVLHAEARSERRWHAESMLASYDCSIGTICRPRPGTSLEPRVEGGPNEVVRTINALGFRGWKHPPVRPDPQALRVALFGDSMTYGLGVADGDTIAENLRRELEARLPGRPVEVLNFGLPMNYLDSNLETYRDFARRYTPDAVVFDLMGGPVDAGTPKDINYRIRTIKGSGVLSSLMTTAWGRKLVNNGFELTWSRFDPEARRQSLLASAATLLEDERARGLRVLFFGFFEPVTGLERILPPALETHTAWSGLDMETYRSGPYIIPDDGHPNEQGTRFFAGRIADALAPLVPAPAP